MKKLIILIQILILLLALAGGVQGATQEIPVSEVLGSGNTATTGPVQYLTDGNPGTVWESGNVTTGPLWAELWLTQEALIDGIQLCGEFRGELAVEYWQDGGWRRFLASGKITGGTAGWNIIDLSYDQIVTNRLRLYLTAAQPVKLGMIGEVKVLGRLASDLIQRLDPVSVSSPQRSEQDHPGNYLFDHNTYSAWWVYPGYPLEAETAADLGENCQLQRIKIFTGENNTNNQNQGYLKLQYQLNGNWIDIPGVRIDLSRMVTGWQSFDLSNSPLTTSKLRIVMTGQQRLGGIREVEIWGKRSQPLGSKYLYGNGAPVNLISGTSANYGFTITPSNKNRYTLHVSGETGQPGLSWELNGQPMGNLNQTSINRGVTLYQAGLPNEAILEGTNFIRINGSGITITDCRIETAPDTGTIPAAKTGLTDGWLLTPVSSNETIIDLGGLHHLDELVIRYLNTQPTVQIAVETNGKWVPVNSQPRNLTAIPGGELNFNGIGLARRIKINSDNPANLSELLVYGSFINDGPPKVKILSPLDGSIFTLSQWGEAKFLMTVDNPEVELKINGQKIYFTGTTIELPLPQFGNPDAAKIIEAVATDKSGRSGSDKITISVSTPPDFTLNLPDQLIYTKEAQITVSGQVIIPTSKITINGVAVPVVNQKFSTQVFLQEGLNLITVRLVPSPGSSQVNTLQRRVVRTSAPPYLKVTYPVNGQITNVEKLIVSGEVGSVNPAKVTVNGVKATVTGGNFNSAPVTLAEGNNKLTVIATDQNGLTAKVELNVQRDRTKPLLSEITPVTNAALNTTVITVNGKVGDASPVSVIVNGVAANVSAGSNGNPLQWTVNINVIEGWNDLRIEARDAAGNLTADTRKVLIDTVPPAKFEPDVNVSGWTNNNKPTVSFSTTDASSGMDHYEVAVDNGAFTGPVTSPYKFTSAIQDGERTIKVKAVDKAGNYTIGEVKVYIDTAPPPVPAGFEVISGIGRAILTWQGEDPKGEITGYRIKRVPAFSTGNIKELTRASDTSDLSKFIDEEVTAGVSYTYSIQARDQAGNYSGATAVHTVTIGIATQNIDSEGGTVKFADCELTLEPGTLTGQSQIVIQQAVATLPDNPYAAKAGPAYTFSLLDSSGKEEEAQFDNPVTLVISYADYNIPEGYNDGNLGVYWYNQAGGYWEKLDYSIIDYANETITVKLSHFSDYQVMASKYNSPSLDSYYNMGITPFQSYFQNNVESVSPMSGSLAIGATDLKLPGRGGFDLEIKRIYDSTGALQERIMAGNPEQDERVKAPIDTFGGGWSLNIPWIEKSDKGRFIRLPEGQTVKINFPKKDKWVTTIPAGSYPDLQAVIQKYKPAPRVITFEYHEGLHFIFKTNIIDFIPILQGYNINYSSYYNITWQPVVGSYTLTMNNGIKFQFDGSGRVTQVADPSGINTITYSYNPTKPRQLEQITDSIGRVVNFHYKTVGNKSLIDSITTGVATANIRTIRYEYNQGNDALTDVYDPVDRHTNYGYETHTFRSGVRTQKSGLSGGGDDNRFYYTVDLLNTINYPSGGKSVYTYELHDQGYSEKIESKLLGVTVSTVKIDFEGTKVLVTKNVTAGKETSYTYSMNSRIGTFKSGSFVPAYTYMYSCQITSGEKTAITNFQQIVGSILIDNPGNCDNYKGPIVHDSSIIIGDNQTVEKVVYQYNVPLRAVTREDHYRSNKRAYYVTSEYDKWGNPTYFFNSSNNLEQRWEYYKQDILTIKNLVAKQIQNNKNGDKVSTVTTIYTYDDYGKPDSITVNDGTKSLVTKVLYDDFGNVAKKTEEYNDSLETYFYYDDTCHAFPKRKVLKNIRNADGTTADIVTYCEYNWETGQKISETDARGFKTGYEYDKLNRLTKVILPDDDQDDKNNPYRKFEFDDARRICVYTNEKGQQSTYYFDKLDRLIEVVKNTTLYPDGIRTKYHYNTSGQIDQVTDERGNITAYLYDGLNRVTKVTYPGGAHIGIDYYDTYNIYDGTLKNTVKITDENGGIVYEHKDQADRLVLAEQYCSYEGKTDVYTWQFAYDSLGNKVQQIDPRMSRSDQTYDALGHLIEVKMPIIPVVLPDKANPSDYRPIVSYEYNPAGFQTGVINANENAKGSKNKTSYEYDQLGRLIKTTVQATDIFSGETVSLVTRNYYDAAGNKIKTIDPQGGVWEYTYSARCWLLSEKDAAGHIIRYQYDVLGNKVAVTDPRGNGTDGSFTTWYQYDELNRLIKTILPDNTPRDLSDNPFTEISYDISGNKLSERDANGVVTSYTYTARNWVETISLNGQVKTRYYYDAKGNRVKVEDGSYKKMLETKYDSLGRVREVIHPEGNSEKFSYDEVGNRIAVTDGKGNKTQYVYNNLGWVMAVEDALNQLTHYQYDPNGNKVKVVTPNKLELVNQYDELNRVVKNLDSLGKATEYSYDLNGNKKEILDRRGSKWVYQYLPNNLLQRVDVTNGNESYYAEYTYDEAGNRITVSDPGNLVKYNYQDGKYQSDPLNRLNSVDRSFDGATYRTAYQYDKAGLLTGIKYPEANQWLEYRYNQLNQLDEVSGFTAPQGITYDSNGALKSLNYANGAVANYNYDNNLRLNDLQVSIAGKEIFKEHFTYDAANNIKEINDGKSVKRFDYDAGNQLTYVVTPGNFLEQDPTPGTYGLKVGDYLGATWMDFTPVLNAIVGLDYNSSSIGIDFGTVAPGIKKIQIIPDKAYQTHRVADRTLDLYTSFNNSIYTVVPRNRWEFVKDGNGVITITLKERLAARFLKIHVKFDERQTDFKAKDKATFLNELAKMLRVYQEATSRTEEFQYDPDGNRKVQQVTLIQTKRWDSVYYTKSDRLKTDGKYAFKYDGLGNMVEKGNKFVINGDTVTFTTTGEGVEYWQYKYDLLSRLINVTKNGTIVSEYTYDPNGLRVVKRAKGETTHYVFEGTEPIFEKKISTGKVKSYVYALGKYLARVDGVIGDTNAKVYFYHTDYKGSIRAITDQAGKIVFNADYLAFGTKFTNQGEFDELHGFTGKEWDPDVGLYYFNARWYDPELGRFISEDPAADPNNPNLYSYCGNNPVIRIDPTGMVFGWDDFLYAVLISAAIQGLDSYSKGGDFWAGAFVGAVGGAIGYGFGQALGGTALANALAIGLTSGTMAALMGGDFGEAFVSGFVSGAISAWLSEKIPEPGYKNKTGKLLSNGARSSIIKALSAILTNEEFSFIDLLSSFGVDYLYDKDYDSVESDENFGTDTNTSDYNVRLPVEGPITSGYGYRDYLYPGEFHPGIDISVPEGTPVKATAKGKVIYAGSTTGGYGNVVVVDHGIDLRTGKHMYTMYEHNMDGGLKVKAGDRVKAGTIIALSGNTGQSSGPHVHYTIVAVPKGGASWFKIYKNDTGNPINLKALSQKYDLNDPLVAKNTQYRRLYSVNPLKYKWF